MTLVEGVVYVGILAIIATLFMGAAVTFFQSFVEVRASRAVAAAGEVALERIVRETRGATAIRDADSIFDSDAGALALDTSEAGIAVVRVFSKEGNRVVIRTNGRTALPLTPPSIVVQTFRVTKLSNAKSQGARVSLVVRDARVHATTTTTFDGAAILRSSY